MTLIIVCNLVVDAKGLLAEYFKVCYNIKYSEALKSCMASEALMCWDAESYKNNLHLVLLKAANWRQSEILNWMSE